MWKVKDAILAKAFVNDSKTVGTIVIEGKCSERFILHGASVTSSVTGNEPCDLQGSLSFQLKKDQIGVVAITVISEGANNKKGDSYLLAVDFKGDVPNIILENLWVSPLGRLAQVTYYGLTTRVGKILVATKGALDQNTRQLIVNGDQICRYLIGEIDASALIKDAESIRMAVPEELLNQFLSGHGSESDMAAIMEALQKVTAEESAQIQIPELEAEIGQLNFELLQEKEENERLRQKYQKILNIAREIVKSDPGLMGLIVFFCHFRSWHDSLEKIVQDEDERNKKTGVTA